jgi:hypothetical protein
MCVKIHPNFAPQMCIENESGHDLRFRPLCCFLESGDALEMTERNIWSNFCIHGTYLQKLSKRFKTNVSGRFFLLAEKCTQK